MCMYICVCICIYLYTYMCKYNTCTLGTNCSIPHRWRISHEENQSVHHEGEDHKWEISQSIHRYIYIYIYIHIDFNVYMYTSTYVYIYTYIYIYIHTYIYIYIHIYLKPSTRYLHTCKLQDIHVCTYLCIYYTYIYIYTHI